MGDTIEHPREYAQRKVKTLRGRWDGPMGDLVREHGPRLWPGVPLTALVGLSASSQGQYESGPAPDYVRGIYGLERNKLPELCEEAAVYLQRDVSAVDTRGHYTDASGVRRAHYLDDLEAQVVTGVLNYRRHLRLLENSAPAALWSDDARRSSWGLRCAAAAYSSGARRPAAVLTEYGAELAALPLEARWLRSAELVAGETRKVIRGHRVRGKWRLAFYHLRGDQRAMCGLELARDVYGDDALEWFAPWVDDHEDLVARLRELADDRSGA